MNTQGEVVATIPSGPTVALAAAHDGELAAVTLVLAADHHVELTETSMLLPDLTFEEYAQVGRLLGRVNRSCSWWIGDWLLYGETAEYAERMEQAALYTGLSPDTLRNRMSVSRAIPPERRRAGIAFSAHAAVASLPPDEQERVLAEAEARDMPVSAVREVASEAAGREPRDTLLAAARHVVSTARVSGDEYLVPRGALERLAALTE